MELTGIEILKQNNKEAAKALLHKLTSEKIPLTNPKLHANLLGYPYNKGDFENDKTNGIRRLMVELKILSLTGKHFCPPILLSDNKRIIP